MPRTIMPTSLLASMLTPVLAATLLVGCGNSAEAPARTVPATDAASEDAAADIATGVESGASYGSSSGALAEPAAPSMDVATARAAILDPGSANRDAALEAFSQAATLPELRELSVALWSGQGAQLDRAGSARLALAAFEREPQNWSALRAGIGLVNGTGVEADPVRAVEVLGHPSLGSNAAAPFYQGQAHMRLGDRDAAREAFQRAADRGNARAVEELEGL